MRVVYKLEVPFSRVCEASLLWSWRTAAYFCKRGYSKIKKKPVSYEYLGGRVFFGATTGYEQTPVLQPSKLASGACVCEAIFSSLCPWISNYGSVILAKRPPSSFDSTIVRQIRTSKMIYSIKPLHKITQQPPLSPFSNVNRAARVAASKTSSTPSPVSDEHSRYLRAPISRAALLPSFSVKNRCDFFLISSCAIGSSRKSFLRPTRMTGTFGHRSFASSTHYITVNICQQDNTSDIKLTLCLTLSRESGVSMEKPINMTCAFEYANGRSRS